MVITSEYSTGMIRTSLTAQPRRGVVYAAKAIAFTSVTLVVSLSTAFIAFFAVQAVYASTGVGVSLFHTAKIPANAMMNCLQRVQVGPSQFRCTNGTWWSPAGTLIHPSTVLAAIIGTALFVTLVALIAYGVGALVRHTAGAIAIVIALMFIIPILENTLPSNWHNDIQRFLPDAANQVVSVTIAGNGPAPGVGLAAARRDRAVGGGPGRRRRLPLPQARRLNDHVESQPLKPNRSSQYLESDPRVTPSGGSRRVSPSVPSSTP